MQPSYTDFQNNIKNDNSDTFWLIFADYCDENEISHDIREQIREPYSEIWCFEWGTNNSVGCNVASVGGYTGFTGGDDVGGYTSFIDGDGVGDYTAFGSVVGSGMCGDVGGFGGKSGG